MTSRWRAWLGVAVALPVALGGCGEEDASATEVPLPAGLVAYVDQSRAERDGREVFVRLVDSAPREVTVTAAVVSWGRTPTVTWRGEETFDHEVDLEIDLPQGRCGRGSEAEVRLSYRLDDGPPQVSTTRATDRYGAIGLQLDRDCAAGVLEEAATLEVGRPRVVGAGPGSVLELPVELDPTGARDDVVVRGFGDTVLFSQASGSASSAARTRIPLGPGDPTASVRLRVVPARCDPHALAEDKVGTLFPVQVEAPGVPESGADPYLPLDDAGRTALRAFVPVHCGW